MNLLLIVVHSLVIAFILLGALGTVAKVGQPRGVLTGSLAVRVVIFAAVMIALLANGIVRLAG